MSIILKRNYNIYISKAPAGSADSTNTMQILVKDFSFNQAARLNQVDRNTLSATQERTVDPYIETVAPVSFSFTTYITPLVDTNVTSPEEYLWTSLMGNDSIAGNPNSTPTSSTIDFAEANVGALHELTLWIVDPNNPDLSYRLNNAIIDSANISFNINEISTIEWTGRALTMSKSSEPSQFTDRTNITSYLKNKLSTISFQVGDAATSYNVALTDGNIEIDNNCTFYSSSQIGKVTTPVGHYTNNRSIKGSLTFYIKQGTNLSADLYDTLLSNITSDTYESDYYADLTINLGGSTLPYIQINVPRTILEIPSINFEEALTMQVPFTAKEGLGSYSTIIYYA